MMTLFFNLFMYNIFLNNFDRKLIWMTTKMQFPSSFIRIRIRSGRLHCWNRIQDRQKLGKGYRMRSRSSGLWIFNTDIKQIMSNFHIYDYMKNGYIIYATCSIIQTNHQHFFVGVVLVLLCNEYILQWFM